jgi:hypothetical protein
MDTFIVYVDDAHYTKTILTPLLGSTTASRWILVACAPRMSRRIGKWLSHSSRENWRDKWCEKLFSQITPTLHTQRSEVQVILEYVVAKGPLPELTQQLHNHFGAARVVDARRPKFDPELAHVIAEPPRELPGWPASKAVV